MAPVASGAEGETARWWEYLSVVGVIAWFGFLSWVAGKREERKGKKR